MTRRTKFNFVFLIIGLVMTPIALVLAVASAGAGHGDYVLAGLLFPLQCLVKSFVTWPLVVTIAVLQYPFYGWLADRALNQAWARRTLIVALGIHTGSAIVLFR